MIIYHSTALFNTQQALHYWDAKMIRTTTIFMLIDRKKKPSELENPKPSHILRSTHIWSHINTKGINKSMYPLLSRIYPSTRGIPYCCKSRIFAEAFCSTPSLPISCILAQNTAKMINDVILFHIMVFFSPKRPRYSSKTTFCCNDDIVDVATKKADTEPLFANCDYSRLSHPPKPHPTYHHTAPETNHQHNECLYWFRCMFLTKRGVHFFARRLAMPQISSI